MTEENCAPKQSLSIFLKANRNGSFVLAEGGTMRATIFVLKGSL